MKTDAHPSYQTSDLAIASYLVVKHSFKLLDVTWNGPRAFFVLEPSNADAIDAVKKFYQGDEAPALDLCRTLAQLKGWLYASRKNED